MRLKPANFEGCLFLKKNLEIFPGEDFGPCPDNFRSPNFEDCPRAEMVPSDIRDNESESSDIEISSDDES